MKIQSHEIAMQSEHSLSRVELETKLSFSTVCLQTQAESEAQTQAQTEVSPEIFGFNSYNNDTLRSIHEIMQTLINSFMKGNSTDMSEINSNEPQTEIYHHISLMQRYEEHEKLDFSTTGCIQTDNGSLDINVNFSMSRSFVIENHIDIYSKFDPLVINLDGDIPDLDTDTFSFDLDNDGKCDQISTLGSGSGFLALDKNGDGIVNQGTELFGTITGNGFGELSEYDDDSNSWIDENDTIFDKLQIWLKNEDNNEKELVGLGEVGIGAIFLGSQTSEFTYKTNMNQTLGEMKRCGIFLNENGTSGTISQIDFASRTAKDTVKDTAKDEPFAELLQA